MGGAIGVGATVGSAIVAPVAGTRLPSLIVPSRALTVTIIPSVSVEVAVRVPTTQGIPSSRETIAACDVIPPASVTTAAARRINGTQSGEVIAATRISPGRSRAE